MVEEWRGVSGYPAYEVSSLGRIRSFHSQTTNAPFRYIKPHKVRNGYLHVTLCNELGKRQLTLHRVVAIAFHGPAPKQNSQCAHWDGDRENNRAVNLRWASPSENARDRQRHGTNRPGELNPRAKLTDADALSILRASVSPGFSQIGTALRYGVDPGTISHLVRRRTFKHLPWPRESLDQIKAVEIARAA